MVSVGISWTHNKYVSRERDPKTRAKSGDEGTFSCWTSKKHVDKQ